MTQGSRQLSDIELQNLQSKYDNMVLRTAYIYLKDVQLAEDAYQETFLKIYKSLPSFEDQKSERMWVTRVTINVCKDFYRKKWLRDIFKSKSYEDIYESEYTSQTTRQREPENVYVLSEEKNEILEKVVHLPSTYKDVIILYYYNGYNAEEIGKITGATSQNVRKRLERARKMLKESLERSDIPYGQNK